MQKLGFRKLELSEPAEHQHRNQARPTEGYCLTKTSHEAIGCDSAHKHLSDHVLTFLAWIPPAVWI
jgi:hypothetical protein